MKEEIIKLIDNLRSLDSETEWVEFKMNHQAPEKIGEYISALANSACLHQRQEAYLVFGIDNKTRSVVGTKFNFRKKKGKGNEDLEPWLYRNLRPKIDFKVEEVDHPGGRVVIFFITPASEGPIGFLGKKWIRIGSSKSSLDDYPDKEAIIWERRISFEEKIALENVSEKEVLDFLDYDKYFRLTGETRSEKLEDIIEKFLKEKFLLRRGGKLHITNLGAILLARDLNNFPKLKSKSVRIITYKDNNRLDAIRDIIGNKGYAVGFANIISYIQSQVPENELIESVLRTSKSVYPTKTLREFVANALVHQDFLVSGSSPVIEIFENKIEISNPGSPLIDPSRFMDSIPLSRNEKLTDTLRRMKICEKRGSGVDRAVLALERNQLPAPNIEHKDNGVRVTLYSKKEVSRLTKEEKLRACYFHSCICHVVFNKPMTNSSLCERLGIEDKNKAIASRIIKEALGAGLIKPFDPNNRSNKYASYSPFWM